MVMQSETFHHMSAMLIMCFSLSVSSDPVSLGRGKDRYEWTIYVWQFKNWRLFHHIFIASFKVPYRWTSVPRFSLLRCLSSAFTGTFPRWSSLSFTNSLSSVPGMIPLPPLFQPFALLFSCFCSTLGSVSFVSLSSPIFLLLRWFESSSRVAPCKQKRWR